MRIHPWLLAVLGLTAFGLLVWFAGPLASIGNSTPLASDDARIALIAAFALQYLVHKGWSAWSARRRNERVVDQLAPAASGAEPAELAQLRKRFSAALATLRRTRFERPARKQPGRTRERTHYTLTDQGREALTAWLAEPAAMARVQHEALVKLLAADFSDDATILASLKGLRQGIADAYARLGPLTERAEQLPHRTRYLRLINDFGRRSLDTLSDWLDHVERELESKRDERDPRSAR